MRWLIIADDLTGAADCAIAFARRGVPACVRWGVVPADDEVPVVSYNADSRGTSAEEAVRRQLAALHRLHTSDRILFKKIDSTLRGHPAAETAAAMALLKGRSGRAFGILAPAFPAAGRTVVDGCVRVDGRPLEECEVWRREHSYPSADLSEVLASAGIRTARVDLAAVRGAAGAALNAIAASGDGVAVCDAQTDHDLELIARAGLALDSPGCLFIGSAGLAHALAQAGGESASQPPVLSPSRSGTLIVVGSISSVSRASAGRLAAGPDVVRHSAAPQMLLDGAAAERSAFAERVANTLSHGRDALVEIEVGEALAVPEGPALAASLASILVQARPTIGALVATGGETAAALMGRLGIDGMRLVDEIEPGVPLGLTIGQLEVPVATKAGAFGNEGTLTSIANRLRAIRLKGSFL